MTTQPQSSDLFSQLTKQFANHSMEIQQAITAHVRARSGHNTLPSFHFSNESEQTKADIYCECLNAIRANNYSGLEGTVPTGQAYTPTPTPPTLLRIPVSGDKVTEAIVALVEAIRMEMRQTALEEILAIENRKVG